MTEQQQRTASEFARQDSLQNRRHPVSEKKTIEGYIRQRELAETLSVFSNSTVGIDQWISKNRDPREVLKVGTKPMIFISLRECDRLTDAWRCLRCNKPITDDCANDDAEQVVLASCAIKTDVGAALRKFAAAALDLAVALEESR